VAVIAYNNFGGRPGYGVVLLNGSDVSWKRLDTPDGKPVQLTELEAPSWMKSWRNDKRIAVLQAAKVPLADAIKTAEASQDGAPAVVAGIARSAGNNLSDVQAYAIGILKDGKLRRVAVNTMTGSLIADPSALNW
jgi:hypothetical protein